MVQYFAKIDSTNTLVAIDYSRITRDGYDSTNVKNIEVTEEVFNNYHQFGKNYYIYQNDEIVINPNYEAEEAKKLKQKRIEEIKEELNELDLKSIRSIRANETDRIAQYEIQAQALRDELNRLIEELEEENEI